MNLGDPMFHQDPIEKENKMEQKYKITLITGAGDFKKVSTAHFTTIEEARLFHQILHDVNHYDAKLYQFSTIFSFWVEIK